MCCPPVCSTSSPVVTDVVVLLSMSVPAALLSESYFTDHVTDGVLLPIRTARISWTVMALLVKNHVMSSEAVGSSIVMDLSGSEFLSIAFKCAARSSVLSASPMLMSGL